MATDSPNKCSCGGALTSDPETGEMVCTKCGMVVGYNPDIVEEDWES